jgi:hypothetical protein
MSQSIDGEAMNVRFFFTAKTQRRKVSQRIVIKDLAFPGSFALKNLWQIFLKITLHFFLDFPRFFTCNFCKIFFG